MNEITAAIKEAIKNKAESSWEETTKHFENGVNPTAFILGYTCGGEDAIGFMLKFVEWRDKNYRPCFDRFAHKTGRLKIM